MFPVLKAIRNLEFHVPAFASTAPVRYWHFTVLLSSVRSAIVADITDEYGERVLGLPRDFAATSSEGVAPLIDGDIYAVPEPPAS